LNSKEDELIPYGYKYITNYGCCLFGSVQNNNIIFKAEADSKERVEEYAHHA
jgi:hypothetical protein